ncbi:unnamed protein product [Linum trigynum]|uniref:Uncharacterized protein n=1 Tax=Linum trigynum TaxID=586398 RepID=A0AAV2DPU3_9ROSI
MIGGGTREGSGGGRVSTCKGDQPNDLGFLSRFLVFNRVWRFVCQRPTKATPFGEARTTAWRGRSEDDSRADDG